MPHEVWILLLLIALWLFAVGSPLCSTRHRRNRRRP